MIMVSGFRLAVWARLFLLVTGWSRRLTVLPM